MRSEKNNFYSFAATFTIPVFFLCVIAGNRLFAVVLKLGKNNLFELNLIEQNVIHRIKLKAFRP